MNDLWIKWAKRSFTTYLKTLADTLGVGFSIDQMDSDVAQKLSNYINFKSTIEMAPVTSGQTRITVIVELLFHFQRTGDNIYIAEDYKGKVVTSLASCIPMTDDSNSTLGSFQFPRGIKNPIRILDLMNKDQTSRVAEIVFSAPFELTL